MGENRLSLSSTWKHTGTFVMINTHDDHIYFNTLEPAPHAPLRKILKLINYNRPMVFISFRDKFRSVVSDVISENHLEITFTRNMYYKYPDVNFKIE